MRVLQAAITVLCLVILSASSDRVVRVLPLGDSLTSCSGVSAAGDFAYLSYRRFLWNLIHVANVSRCVRFVGSQRGCNRKVDELMANASSFPLEHEAVFGRTATETDRKVHRLDLSRHLRPDIVLVLLGINDLMQGKPVERAVSAIVRIAAHFRVNRSSTEVLVSTVLPVDPQKVGGKKRDKLTRVLHDVPILNAALKLALAGDSMVRVVDIAVTFDAVTMTYDGIHPNEQGEMHIAHQWMRSLATSLTRACVAARIAAETSLAKPPAALGDATAQSAARLEGDEGHTAWVVTGLSASLMLLVGLRRLWSCSVKR